MSFTLDLPLESASIIKVIGVGGGGGNAVAHMYEAGIKGVDFILCNTDNQALERSAVPTKITLGTETEGRGAGSNPEAGRKAAMESLDEVKNMLGENTKMVFITAGMGGGTGTGAAPVIAKAARDLGILTVGIVTLPFTWEGRKRRNYALEGLEALKKCVDTYIVIDNDRLSHHGKMGITGGFRIADDVLTVAAKGIAEIITESGYVNVDFEDIKTVMKDSGTAIMGSATAEGEDRAAKAISGALNSPLLLDSDITGAKYVLLNIASGTNELTMDELSFISNDIQEKSSSTAELIWGYNMDPNLGEKISVTVIITGFQGSTHLEEAEAVHKSAAAADTSVKHTPLEVTNARAWQSAPAAQEPLNRPEPVTASAPRVEEPLGNVERVKDDFADEQDPYGVTPLPVRHISGTDRYTADNREPNIIHINRNGDEGRGRESNRNQQYEAPGLFGEGMRNTGITGNREQSFGHGATQPQANTPFGQYSTDNQPPVNNHGISANQSAQYSAEPRDPNMRGHYYQASQAPGQQMPQSAAHHQPVMPHQPQPMPQQAIPNQQAPQQVIPQQPIAHQPAPQQVAPQHAPASPAAAGVYGNDTYREQLPQYRTRSYGKPIRTDEEFSEAERRPAYERRGVKLTDLPHSSDRTVSRLTLEVTDDGGTQLRRNNSFLDDQVD